MKYPLKNAEPTTRDCFGTEKQITLSWSRLKDWESCHQRVKLIMGGKRSQISNARNALVGNLVDHCMREALEKAPKDPKGRLADLTLKMIRDPLAKKWEEEIAPDRGVMLWRGADPAKDQREVLDKVVLAMEKLFPILETKVLGRRFIPEFRPKEMPVIGIPGPDGETAYIRLYLAVDVAVQVEEENSDDPKDIGQWGLYDLKTSENEEYINSSLRQPVFYDLAFHALTGQYAVDWGLWVPLVDKTPIRTIKVTNEDRRDLLSSIIGYCHGVWAGDDAFTANPKKECYNCVTKRACPRVIQPVSKDEQGNQRVVFGSTVRKK